MKLSVASEDPERPARLPRACRHQPDNVIMGIGSEQDRRRIAGSQFRRNMGLGLGPYLAHHLVPFIVRQSRRVLPALDLALEGSVGPQMVAMRREMQSPRIGAEAFSEQRLEAQSPNTFTIR